MLSAHRQLQDTLPSLGTYRIQQTLEIVESKLINEEQRSLCAQKVLGRKLGFKGTEYHKASKVLKKVAKMTQPRLSNQSPLQPKVTSTRG